MTTRGVHLYTMRGAVASSPADIARRARLAAEARVRLVWLPTESSDGRWHADPAQLERAAALWREADLAVGLYAFPGVESMRAPVATARRLASLVERCGATAAQLDLEGPAHGRHDEVATMRQVLTDSVTERVDLYVSTLGTPQSHPRFPWDAVAGWGTLIWQAYLRSARRSQVRRGLELMRGWWGTRCVIPAVATYRRQQTPAGLTEGEDGARRLRGDAERACLADPSAPESCDVPGLALWSESSWDASERAAVAELSSRWWP